MNVSEAGIFIRCFLTEMDKFNPTQMVFQVLCNKPAMAAVRFILAAQQASVCNNLVRNGFFDPPFAHQRNESVLVSSPIATSLSVVVQQLLGRRQFWDVNVIHITEFAQKIREVVLLRETGKLRPIVEPNIDDTPGAGLAKQIEKTVGGFSCEADGEGFHIGEVSGFAVRFSPTHLRRFFRKSKTSVQCSFCS